MKISLNIKYTAKTKREICSRAFVIVFYLYNQFTQMTIYVEVKYGNDNDTRDIQ